MSGKKPVWFAGSFTLILAMVVLLSVAQAYAQTTVVAPAGSTSGPAKSGWPGVDKSVRVVYPAEGEVTADNVLIRAGSGLNYYICGRLSQRSKVVVHENRYGFLRIDPPKGCFSLIAADYVEASKGSDEGVVTGTVVRVRAGAIDSEQIYAIQGKLNTDDKVRILGTVTYDLAGKKQNFYKIEPPAGKAFLWISDQYVRYVKPYEKPLEIEEPVQEFPSPVEVEPLPKSPDRLELEKLDQALRIEMRRPIAERRLAEHLAKYLALQTNIQSPAITNLVENRIEEIRRYMEIQTALQKSEKIREDYESSQQRMQELYKKLSKTTPATQERIVERTGLLKRSYVFRSQGMERWRLVEPSTGKNICYLMPGKVSADVLESNQGKIVSLSGSAVFDLRIYLDLVVVNKIQADSSAAEDK